MTDQREQYVRFRGAGHQLPLLVEQHDTRPARSVGGRAVQEDGLAEGMRDVWGQPADDLGLGRGEAERTVLAVQAQVAPAVTADHECGR